MTIASDVYSATAVPAQNVGMKTRADISEPGWAFWELRTINIHRVVGLASSDRQFADAGELGIEMRSVLSRNFKRAWWRGIAYGVVMEVAVSALRTEDLKMLVDVRENDKGTMQWVILVNSTARTALGVHTWIEGLLSPVYRSSMETLRANGYKIASIQRDKDGLMKFLTSVADLDLTIHSLGTRRTMFPAFREVSASSPNNTPEPESK